MKVLMTLIRNLIIHREMSTWKGSEDPAATSSTMNGEEINGNHNEV
jgi:hypothetical protein